MPAEHEQSDVTADQQPRSPIPVNEGWLARKRLREQLGITEEASENKQWSFLTFLQQRIQAGNISLGENGLPMQREMHHAIKLFYREEAHEEQPLLPNEPQPLTEQAVAYIQRLTHSVQMAAGHTDRALPSENSMHMIVRKLQKKIVAEQNQGNPNEPNV